MKEKAVRHRIAVVIVHYRTPGLVGDCLDSLVDEVGSNDIVLVVDNASGDGSADRIEEMIRVKGWDTWVRLIRSERNGGFSAGNNIGIKAVDAEAYLLLNSDTIVRPGALALLYEGLAAYPQAGIVSPRLEWPDGEGQISCFLHATPITELLHAAKTGFISQCFPAHDIAIPLSDEPTQPCWTSFACVMIRGEAIARTGFMDEGYFMYFEDMDYCKALQAEGYTIQNIPAARVIHLRGGSGDVKKLTAERKPRPAYFYAARARYFAKHYGLAGLWLTNVCFVLGRCVSLTRETFGNKQPHLCERELRNIWRFCLRPLRPWRGENG